MSDRLNRVMINMDDAPDRERIRREPHEGVEHLVVPVVMIVEGVLNDALVPVVEFGRHVESWNGIPVPVLHPQERGEYISANRPDVIDKNTIGRVYNAWVDGRKLKAELWLNTDKAARLGYGQLIEALADGEVIEISTGYFSDDEPKAGEYDGVGYNAIHRNIKPDHLALLPGEIGACSVADGCGTRVNTKSGGLAMKVNEAINTLAKALGLRSNCNCEEEDGPMDLMKQAEALKSNGSMTAKQFQMVQEMDEEQREMLAAIIGALGNVKSQDEPDEEGEPAVAEYEDKQNEEHEMSLNSKGVKTFSEQDVERIVANQMRRQKVMDKITANEACAFEESDLHAMSVEALEKYEKSIRPADYSGAGGFATNSDAIDTNVQPLRANGVLSKIKSQKGA